MGTPKNELSEPSSQGAASYEHGNGEAHVQFLTFSLGGELYGVDVLRVLEIKGWVPVTVMPNTPDFLRGVLDLRGAIVPIIDLRMRFNLEHAEYTAVTVIVVLSVHTDKGERTIGVVVDSVADVINISTKDIKPAPDFGAAVKSETAISGLVSTADRMVMLLDIDKVLTLDEIRVIERADLEQTTDQEQS